jgi:hypothetical protein
MLSIVQPTADGGGQADPASDRSGSVAQPGRARLYEPNDAASTAEADRRSRDVR